MEEIITEKEYERKILKKFNTIEELVTFILVIIAGLIIALFIGLYFWILFFKIVFGIDTREFKIARLIWNLIICLSIIAILFLWYIFICHSYRKYRNWKRKEEKEPIIDEDKKNLILFYGIIFIILLIPFLIYLHLMIMLFNVLFGTNIDPVDTTMFLLNILVYVLIILNLYYLLALLKKIIVFYYRRYKKKHEEVIKT